MHQSKVRFAWREPQATENYRTGICLHGHTMHSQECLSFLPRYLHVVPGVSQVVSYYERVRQVDFARAWWTPPLTPASALHLEREQIEKLDLFPIVSLTDHDDIEAGMTLGITEDHTHTPISVEWTVPYERTYFHLGIHNLPRSSAREWMDAMAAYTGAPEEERLPGMLADLANLPDLLIVLNHPYWLEEGVVEEDHERALGWIMRECGCLFDAIEFNGTRPWKENASAIELARACERPLISGGDRHACEPSACLNLSNARTFGEFVSEIHAGVSSILVLPHYLEPMAQRVLDAAHDILRTYPEYPGRERWTDRIFYRGGDGVVRSLTQVCGGREPRLVAAAAAAVQFFGGARFRPALRLFLQRDSG